jgi:hypothetical protein
LTFLFKYLQVVCTLPEDRLVLPALEVAIPGVETVQSSLAKDRARFYTSRIRTAYTLAQQLMIERISLESNEWEGLEEGWELGDVRSPERTTNLPSGHTSWIRGLDFHGAFDYVPAFCAASRFAVLS